MLDGGFRVGVSITRAERAPWPADATPPGAVDRPSRLGEVLPPRWRSDTEIASDLQRIVQIEAALAAYRVELVTELASRRPAALNTPLGRPRDAVDPVEEEPSEFFADELAAIHNSSVAAASALYELARVLTERLPATWAALADGRIDWPRARALAAELGRPADDTDPQIVAAVEAALLPVASELSLRRLREAARRELLARDAAAAERRRRAAEELRDVKVRTLGDGMAELTSLTSVPSAQAMRDTVDQLAWMRKKDGDLRPIGVIRAEVLEDLVLRPWDTSRPPVTAHLGLVVPLDAFDPDTGSGADGDPGGADGGAGRCAPVGQVDGEPITAAHVRQLLGRLAALGLQAPPGGSLDIAIVDRTGTLRATTTRWELTRLVRAGCATHPTDTDGDRDTDCGCAVLSMPPEVDRYRPTPAQYRFVRTRDRTCRHPGCTNKAGWADLDHVIPHADGGPTTCTNLCCACRRHHRLKTHARGWRFVLTDDGVLHVTTPSGVTRTTRPPGLMTAPDPPAPTPAVDDDPPPF